MHSRISKSETKAYSALIVIAILFLLAIGVLKFSIDILAIIIICPVVGFVALKYKKSEKHETPARLRLAKYVVWLQKESGLGAQVEKKSTNGAESNSGFSIVSNAGQCGVSVWVLGKGIWVEFDKRSALAFYASDEEGWKELGVLLFGVIEGTLVLKRHGFRWRVENMPLPVGAQSNRNPVRTFTTRTYSPYQKTA